MELSGLAIEFHCSHCGVQGMGVMSVKEQLSLKNFDSDSYVHEDESLCPRCGSKVITLVDKLVTFSD